jgi:energy-coupling factor transporter ATP-binding protein EcfA2
MDNTDVGGEVANWPDSLPDHIIESPVQDLLHEPIDYSQNILGNLWLERGSINLIQGWSGIGKSTLSVQMGVEAALGRETFGLKVDRPLKVLIVQAEDPKNKRIRQSQCIWKIARTQEEEILIHQNLRIVTPRKRALRSESLFKFLGETFKDANFDLTIINPIFSFIEGNINDTGAVGDFFRDYFQEFLRKKNAGGLVIHHLPKPPKSGIVKASQYSGHGSAEFANAPRGVITITRTFVPYVFEFTVVKGAGESGWQSNQAGDYVRYFTHSRIKGEMLWLPVTEQDINAAMSGISADDFSQVFRGDVDLTFEVIRTRFKVNGYSYTDEEISNILDAAIERGKLNAIEEDGQTVYRTVKSAKKAAENVSRMEEVFALIRDAGETGIITGELRKKVSFGNSLLAECLEELVQSRRIWVRSEGSNTKRYFATGSSLAVI